MILKQADDKSEEINQLEAQISQCLDKRKKKQLSHELRNRKSGIQGEKNTSFYLNDRFAESQNCYVIHDLRLEYQGRIAQIDHLLINRLLDVYVIETKRVHAGIKINEEGEFSRWNNYGKQYEDIPSPLHQNERHIEILKEIFKYKVNMPKRLGFTLQPKFHSRVLINPEARITRPSTFKTTNVMKADAFCKSYDDDYDDINILNTLTSVAKIINAEDTESIANQLVAMHRPKKINNDIQYNPTQNATVEDKQKNMSIEQEKASYSTILYECAKCKSNNLMIEYGRYGYYFKCLDCKEGTSIKLECNTKKCTARIRKSRNQFFKECANCETSELYFENKDT